MSLLRLDEISLEFGDQVILQNADFSLQAGERVCLVGRNGAGKSSMFRLITGQVEPDHGAITRQDGILISELTQTLPGPRDQTVRDAVSEGLHWLRSLCDTYRERASQVDPDNRRALQELTLLEQQIDSHGGWRLEQRVDEVISELGLDSDAKLSELSGGWRRRVALAKALVCRPELLLLDEPTNHLDLSTIEWLEGTIHRFPGSVMFISHDRTFVERLATRIVELDRGQLSSWPGDYGNYVRSKEKALAEEQRANELFDKRLAAEETWIRQGIQARRTRNEGRVRALESMREERAQRRGPQDPVRLHIENAERSGKKVIEARNISCQRGGKPLIQDFSLRVMRGDRIGIIGNNGVGKSTLLKLLLGELSPDTGSLKLGTGLEVGVFDPLKEELDEDKTVADVVGDGREYVLLNGRHRHVVGYLKGFLFSPKRALTPIKALSGGERNRVILARLFTTPANLLVLDEPTNDLDIETLNVLEEKLLAFEGTLIVVSHDRTFLDHVAQRTIVFEEGLRIGQYLGGYSDWLSQRHALANREQPARQGAPASPHPTRSEPARNQSGKLTYKLKRELEELPGRIEALEFEVASLREQTLADDFYRQPYTEVNAVLKALAEREHALDQAIERWSELEEASEGARRGHPVDPA